MEMTSVSATSLPSETPPGVSLGAWLTDILQQRITNGGYRPGDWIREATLRAEFGVSNGPVREAMQNLAAVGLLERVPRRGVRVLALSDQAVIDLFELRLALLELASEIAARVVTADDLERVAPAVQRMDHAIAERDIDATVIAGAEMVDWVFDVAGNSELHDAWTQSTLRTRIYINAALTSAADFDREGRLWRGYFDAVASGTPQRAREAARVMIGSMLDSLGLETRF